MAFNALDTCKEFFAVSDGGGKDQNTVEKVALENAKTAADPTASKKTTSEKAAGVPDDSGGTSASDAARADR